MDSGKNFDDTVLESIFKLREIADQLDSAFFIESDEHVTVTDEDCVRSLMLTLEEVKNCDLNRMINNLLVKTQGELKRLEDINFEGYLTFCKEAGLKP